MLQVGSGSDIPVKSLSRPAVATLRGSQAVWSQQWTVGVLDGLEKVNGAPSSKWRGGPRV